MSYTNKNLVDMYPRALERTQRLPKGASLSGGLASYWGQPTLSGLGTLPPADYMLQAGQIYTLIIGLDGRPSASTVSDTINNNNKGVFFDLISVTSTFSSYDYNVVVRMKNNMPYSRVISLLRIWINTDLGYTVQEVDFKGGVVSAPGLVQEITSGVSAPISGVAKFTSGITSDVKWIVIGVAVIAGLFYLTPMLRKK